jgi:phospholipase/carboxylesterase
MLTMDYTLRSDGPPPARLLQFSGTLICRDRWRTSAKRLSGTPVFQSHGTLDPVLPFAGATALKDLLTEQGVSVAFHSFLGPHTIDPDAVVRSGEILRRLTETPRPD